MIRWLLSFVFGRESLYPAAATRSIEAEIDRWLDLRLDLSRGDLEVEDARESDRGIVL